MSSDFENSFAILVIQKGATLTLTGTFSQPAPPLPGETAGTTRLNGGTITSAQPLNFREAVLPAQAQSTADISSNATISPGASAGLLNINGNVSLLASSKLVMEIGGLTQGTQYDYLAVSGLVGLDGTLELHMLNGFQSQLLRDRPSPYLLQTISSVVCLIMSQAELA